jgi:hypothetical protein
MFSVERQVGRLVEVRTISPLSFVELALADTAMTQAARDARGPLVMCADHRQLAALSGRQTEHFGAVLRRHDARIDVCAVLIGASSADTIQELERVIFTAKNPKRRCFRSPVDAATWLRPYLSPLEAARLEGFLALPARMAS